MAPSSALTASALSSSSTSSASTKFEQVVFDEATDPDLGAAEPWFSTKVRNKGAHELASIRVALARSALIRTAQPHTWIVKVTGRFFVPGLETHLLGPAARGFIAVRQADPNSCQLVGCRLGASEGLFRGTTRPETDAEITYRQRLRESWAWDKVLVLPKMPIAQTKGGGHKHPFTHL